MKEKRLTLRVDENLQSFMKAYCKSEQIAMSDLMRKLILSLKKSINMNMKELKLPLIRNQGLRSVFERIKAAFDSVTVHQVLIDKESLSILYEPPDTLQQETLKQLVNQDNADPYKIIEQLEPEYINFEKDLVSTLQIGCIELLGKGALPTYFVVNPDTLKSTSSEGYTNGLRKIDNVFLGTPVLYSNMVEQGTWFILGSTRWLHDITLVDTCRVLQEDR